MSKIDRRILQLNKENFDKNIIPCSICLKMKDNCKCFYFYTREIPNAVLCPSFLKEEITN
jgi:hypothetical protein